MMPSVLILLLALLSAVARAKQGVVLSRVGTYPSFPTPNLAGSADGTAAPAEAPRVGDAVSQQEGALFTDKIHEEAAKAAQDQQSHGNTPSDSPHVAIRDPVEEWAKRQKKPVAAQSDEYVRFLLEKAAHNVAAAEAADKALEEDRAERKKHQLLQAQTELEMIEPSHVVTNHVVDRQAYLPASAGVPDNGFTANTAIMNALQPGIDEMTEQDGNIKGKAKTTQYLAMVFKMESDAHKRQAEEEADRRVAEEKRLKEEEKDRTDEGFRFEANDGMYKELEIAQRKEHMQNLREQEANNEKTREAEQLEQRQEIQGKLNSMRWIEAHRD